MNRAKAAKPLTKEQYLKRFSRAVRWRLGSREAAEAIADYREMVFQEERDEAKLVEELGDPVQAAWLLTDVRTYRRWLVVFGILALGLFLQAKWCWTGLPFIRFSWDYELYGEGWRGSAVMAVGLVLSLVWFRRHGQKSGPLSRWLLLALAAVAVFLAVLLATSWHMFDPRFLDRYAELSYEQLVGTSLARQIVLHRELVIDGGTICPFIALAGLVLAKCYDRRWLGLYTLALTAAALCVVLECWMRGMDLGWGAIEDIRVILFPQLIPVGLAGLLGTGVALC